MISGIGVDIVQIERIEKIASNEDQMKRFVQRILTDRELSIYQEMEQQELLVRFVAKRFAVKEAASKALGTGFRNGLRYEHIGVRHNELGKPELEWRGVAEQWVEERGIKASHVSISDEREYVVVMVVLES